MSALWNASFSEPKHWIANLMTFVNMAKFLFGCVSVSRFSYLFICLFDSSTMLSLNYKIYKIHGRRKWSVGATSSDGF